MGIASLGIILVHSIDIVAWSPNLEKLFGFGGTGVYVFVFLSAIGLFHSLKSKGGKNKAEFYKRRFKRLIIPYGLIAGTWYGLLDLLVNRNPILFLYDISTLSFWMEHRGAWYVAMLIPVYILFPWFYDWAEAKNRKLRILGSLCFCLGIGLFLSICSPKLYEHLGQVIASLIVCIIGYYYASMDLNDKRNEIIMGTICIVLFLIKAMTLLKNNALINGLSWGMLGIPFTFIAGILLNVIKCSIINTILAAIGKNTLEMYLCNIFIIQAMRIFGIVDAWKSSGDTFGLFTYGIVITLGFLMSFMYGKLSALVSKRIVGK